MTKPKHTFFLESKPNASGEHLIFLNFSYGLREFDVKTEKHKYLPLKLSTGFTIKKADWDNKNYCTNTTYVRKKGSAINIALDKIKDTSIEQLQIFENQHNKKPSNNELKEIILLKLGKTKDTSKDISITKYIEESVTSRTTAEITSKKRWSKATGKQYTNLKNHIENYESEKNTILSFGKLTGEIFMDFFKVINDLNKIENKVYYAHNTIAKENKHFRAILNAAYKENIHIGFNHSNADYEIKRRKINNEIVLTTEHLTTIINTEVSASREFTHARNYILLSSFTGLRIGDMVCLHELEPKNLQHNSTNYFCVTTKIRKNKENKDELTVVLPILDPVKNFLKDNDNKFPKFPAQANIRKDITKFLKHLKFEDIVDIKNYYYTIDDAVITKQKLCDVFTPHDCRSTFITNLKELGIPDETIEPLTHPKHTHTSIVQTYDKTKLAQKAVDLIRILNDKGSELYKY
ncbi:phage integrase SAM-like domain-containing protein [Flavobacterium ovatum]|uniref:phage integrase SAM-like domain-containing protein n=1 Tax=Flavobacterium ovatum TaxID=1928857 RepID=UPI00344E453C